DDFSIADSAFAHSTQMILSDLRMPQGMSFCDTASKGAVEFYVKNHSFLDVENMKVRYEETVLGQKELNLGKIARYDSVKVSVPMGHRLEGEYAFKVWSVMPDELDRSDDTLSGTFGVSGAKGFPFSENFEGVVQGTGAVDVNDDGMVWRILKSEEQARTGSQCLNYPHKNALSGAVFFTDGFLADQTGRFKITFYMKADVEGHDGVGVRVMEYSPQGGFVSSVYIDTLHAGTEYEQYNVPFHVQKGRTYAIAFEYVASRASTEEGQAFFIDDLTTGDITVPVLPQSLAVKDTGFFTATFTCRSMADRNVLRVYSADGKFNRLYEWKKTQQQFEVKGLAPKTEYRAQVRGLNEVNDSSAWSAQVRFVTLDTTTIVIPPDTTANERLYAESRIKVSPNPASDYVQVEVSLGAGQWSLCNAGGKTVLRGTLSSTRFEINLQGLPAGMYFLRVENRKETAVTKIIK
ncbi:MAG: T9SS type A sorting domain-containing protein, partial [Bacteroidales bacterium]|nr:T9SS type A sorting domain-containing protein [Bacteroidales bacterium]